MPTIDAWTQDDDRDLAEGVRQGLKWHEIAAQLGVSPGAARSRYYRVRQLQATRRRKAKTVAAVATRSDASKAESVVIESHWRETEEDIQETWRRVEEDSDRRIRKAIAHSQFTAKFPSNRVSAITFLSDQHIAPGTPVDHRRMREDAELVAGADDLFCVLAGDGVDNHIKHHSAILAARSQPDDQYKLYDLYLSTLKESLLVAISGNHDKWTNQYAGVDMVSWICRHRAIHYSQDEAFIECLLGQQKYTIAARHQYRLNSSFNQTHSVKQWLRLGVREFDIGCIGHHHEAAIEQTIYRDRMVWCCRPGSYQVTSSYSAQYGYNRSMPTCPTFLLFPDRREIIGLASVHHAPRLLKAFNG